MSTSCQWKANHDAVIPTWCLDNMNTNEIMPCHAYMEGMELIVNASDVMPTWFTSHVSPNDMMMGMYDLCMHA